MRVIKTILCFLICIQSIKAQVVELNKLSSGLFYDSEIIKDNKNNIKGYFLLFESDKIQKETYVLEYVVLDENLTKEMCIRDRSSSCNR